MKLTMISVKSVALASLVATRNIIEGETAFTKASKVRAVINRLAGTEYAITPSVTVEKLYRNLLQSLNSSENPAAPIGGSNHTDYDSPLAWIVRRASWREKGSQRRYNVAVLVGNSVSNNYIILVM